MPHNKLSELYSQLINTKFNFIRRGEHHLQDIYREVKLKFPVLCDDNILCSKICSQGTQNPEWQHRVRAALGRLKSKDGLVSKSGRRGYWFFG